MLRPFFSNARTWGPNQARDIIFLVKPDHPGTQKAISRTIELIKKYIGLRALIICMS